MTTPDGADATLAAPATLHLDDTVHQRVRLGILCVLGEIDRAEFTYLRQLLELSDGNLARHLGVLVEAGHVELAKDRAGARSRTWVTITPAGRRALRHEVESLERIVHALRHGPAQSDPERDPQ
jgi:DNA-binding MarR family transcriptional regulator